MSPYRRNLLVGLVMLVALVALGWMVLRFGGQTATFFTEPRITIHFIGERAEGIAEGSAVTFRGVGVGQVIEVRRGPSGLDVIITAVVDQQPPLPENVRGMVRTQGLLGASAVISLEMTGPEPVGALEGDETLPLVFAGLDLLPPEFAGIAGELREVARVIRDTQLIENINQTVMRTGQVMESLNQVVGDAQLRENLQATLTNVRQASETTARIAKRFEGVSENVDELSVDAKVTLGKAQKAIDVTEDRIELLTEQLAARLEQTSKLLANVEQITAKVNQGEGTAGLLVNDPRLYESLVDSARVLQVTVTDLQRLVEQWEQEGVSLRLGGR